MERTDRFLTFIFLSLLLHIVFIFLLRLSTRLTDHSQMAANGVTRPVPIRVQFKNNPAKQVVQVDQPETERPDEAEYFSERNTRADQETRARESGQFRNSKGGARGEGMARRNQRKHRARTELGDRGTTEEVIPELADIVQAIPGGAAQTYDHLNRPEGDQTILNTQEYIYASFFNRIKETIGPLWEKRIGRIIEMVGGNLRAENYVSMLHVTLNREGTVLDVDIIQSAVNREFDEAASESFWEAKRFPNPPSGLFQGKQVAGFDFSFYVNLEQAGRVRLQTVPDSRYLLPPGESMNPFVAPGSPQ